MSETSEDLNAEAMVGDPVAPDRSSTVDEAAPIEESVSTSATRPDDSRLQEADLTDEDWPTNAELSAANAAQAQPGEAPRPTRRSGQREKLTRVTLGGALIAMDTVSERLDRLDDAEIEQAAQRRTLDDVLVPMSEWHEQFGVAVDRPTRHLMLGMMVDARSRASATAGLINRLGNGVAEAVNFLLRPVRTLRLFRPVRQGFAKAVDRGDSQVERWRAMGRAEDARSRALAETALSSAAEETMDELVANERVEFFIQEIVESQTMGILDEIIEEIRERGVSSDNFFEQPVRRLFRRPDRSEVPGPDFDPQLVRPISRRGHPIPAWSLVGQYAGLFSRLLALLVDVSLIVIVLALGSSLFSTAINVLGLRESFDAFVSTSALFSGLFAALNGMIIVIGYMVLFWLLTGQTLGMMLMGVRVVDRSGGRVTLWRAILRFIGYILLPGIFLLGFLWILGDDKRQAWHDKLAGTYVVYAWDARPDETFLTYSMYMEE